MNETMQHRIIKTESPVSTNYNADLLSKKERSSVVNGLKHQHIRSQTPAENNFNDVIHLKIPQRALIHIKSPTSAQKALSKPKLVQHVADPTLEKDDKIQKKTLKIQNWFRECEYLTTGIPIKSTTVPTKTNNAPTITNNVPNTTNNVSTKTENVSTKPNAPTKTNDVAIKTNDAPTKTNNVATKTTNVPTKTNNGPTKVNNAPIIANNGPTKTYNDPTKINNASTKTNNVSTKTNNVTIKINSAPTITNNAPTKIYHVPTETVKSGIRPTTPSSWNLPVIKNHALLKYIIELSKHYDFDHSDEAPPILHDVMLTSVCPPCAAPTAPKSYFSFDDNQCF